MRKRALGDGRTDPVAIGRWVHGGFNALEAGVWLSAAIYLAVRAVRLAPRDRLVALLAAAALLAFSASDVWEISSGTWFRPPALLALKSGCLAILIPALLYYCRRQRGWGMG